MQDQIGNELTAEWTVASFRSLVGSASAVTSHVKSVVIHFSSFGFQGKMRSLLVKMRCQFQEPC